MKKPVKVNSEGRIVIPADMRKILGINDNDELELELVGQEIKLTTKELKCKICNATENLYQSGEIIVCDDCLGKIETNFLTIKEDLNHDKRNR